MDWSVRTGVLHTLLQILCLNFVISYDIHVDFKRTILSDAIFNASLGNGWSYYFDRWSRLKNINDVLSLDSTQGTVNIKNIEQCCKNIQSNPLDVKILAKSYPLASGDSFISNYSIISLRIYFHSLPCTVSFHSSEKTYSSSAKHSVQTVIYSDKFAHWNKLKCMEKGVNVFYLNKHVPISIMQNLCDVDMKTPNFQYHFENSSLSTTRAQCLYESDLKVPLKVIACSDQKPTSVYISIHPVDPSVNTFIVENSHRDHLRLRRQAPNTAPSFAKPEYRATIPENQDAGYSVILITATDPDQGENGKLTYSMTAIRDSRSNDMFTINPISGQVTTTKQLDREEIPRHDFQVTATDNNVMFKKSAVTTLTITVEDENDHTPTFDKDLYIVEKYENIPVATTITTVRAIDRDDGNNREIRYSIIVPTNPSTFKIDPTSGSISTLKVLDREVQANYQLVVQAKDQASFGKQRSSSTTIEIKVLDENDNFPQFVNSPYTVNVSENLDITSRPVIAQVSATDADEGRNQEITYSITGGNLDDTFYIDPTTGEVSVQKPLDYETNKQFNLKVKASDNGKVPKHNSTNVWIRIDDLNDNAPYFQSSVYTGSAFEGESIGTKVLTVRALDDDDGVNGQVSYSLLNVPPAFPFMIDPDLGEIKVRSTLDREIQASYKFTVEVKDKGQPQLSATVSVEVTVNDINDNSPIFSQKIFYASIPEDAPKNMQVIRVTANDADTGQNARLTYEIISGDNNQVFSIERETGMITLGKTLDYTLQNKYILTVRSSDSGPGNRFDTAEVHINVTDINKHTPVFKVTNYQFNVDEGAVVGTSVGKVQAMDKDVGENGRITYEIIGVQEFSIDPVTGEISTREVLNHELHTAYSFEVRASDHGDPVRQDTASVMVIVNDKNNNVPKFDKPVYDATVSEAAFDGHLVTTVHATDADSGINAQINYRFSDIGTGYSDFEIDDASGDIRVASDNRIDREKRNNYTLVVLAVDKGVIPLTGSVEVRIKVEDINDNAPKFAKDEIIALVPENQKIGSTVAVIEADDPDEGINADVEYTLEGGLDADKFLLANQPGDPAIIVNRVDLDYESDKKEYYIRLKAASGPLISTALIIIKVQDVNDNAPVLKDFRIIFNNYVDHFPSEPIGRVPAFDPDVTDQPKLKYEFLMGNEAGFLQLNKSTGEIILDSRLNSDVPRNGTIQVRVSDGLNEVRATCRLQVRLVTMEMLEKSVTIRINNMTSDTFLSPLFTFFVDALATIINVSKENIFLINVRNDTDVKAQILNVTVSVREKSVRIDRQMVDIFYSAEFLKEQIYLQRTLLANLSTLQILPFDDNLCLTEVCGGFEKCLSRLSFGEAAPFISSDTMLFRPIYPDNGYKCECPHGFTNNNSFSYCSVEINLCYSNPCNSSRGTCHSTEEGYTCKCKPGFAGSSCEIDLSSQYDGVTCPANACQPPSVCLPLINGGLRCDHCPDNIDYNEFCQQTARSFPKGSFLMYPTIKSRYRFNIQLKFATQHKNGLLFYNGRFNELHDFMALEIIDAQVQFSFSTGSDIVKVSPYIHGGVHDGKWHKVTVDYLNMTATVTVGEDCDTEISVKYGRPINYTCAARASQQFTMKNCSKQGNPLNCPKLLDLTGPLQIGGLPTLPSNFQVRNKDYVGCMRDFYVDGKLLDFNKSVANNGTEPGCKAKHDHCKRAPCQHGGTCVDGWETYICVCPDNWGGKDCGNMIDPPRKLNGDGYLFFDNSNQLIPNVHFGTKWYNGISFRTRAQNGTLMFISAEEGETVHIELDVGYVSYTYTNRLGSQTFVFDSIMVNDGNWHYFEVRWPDNGDFIMILDYGQRQILHKIQSTLEQKSVISVYVGALKVGVAEAENHFIGCVKDMNVGNKENSVLQRPIISNAQKGCASGDACKSNPCTARATCVNEWEGYTCKCPNGTLGPNCDNICTNYNPCQNEANCRHPYGGSYECECGQLQSGKYCQITSPRSCPQNWWGNPVCGPCPENCTSQNGFNPSCDKTTGKCSCRDNYYKPQGSYVCLPCKCYGHGSKGYQCDPVTGQCPCIEGVTGRRCNQCPSKYAEIRQDEETKKYGCRVDYAACPRIYSHGMWWDTEIANVMITQQCPDDAFGSATRNCSANGLWQKPDFFNCTSKLFSDHLVQIEKIESGSLKINTFVAKTLLASLADTTSQMETMYGNDINITVRIMNKILEYENQQSGLYLTSEQDSHYLSNVLTVLSDILQIKNAGEWSRLNHQGVGAAQLLSKLETYLSTLLSALELTTTESSRPYNVVTDNIVLSVDFINKSNFSGRSIPKFNNIVKTSMFDEDTNIYLPKSTISEPPLKDYLGPDLLTTPKAYVGYIMYKQLGDLLPKLYSDNVRVLSGRPMSVNSPVFTILVKDNGKIVNGSLDDPVVITFKQLQTGNRTSPQCVSWQYDSSGAGRWSTKGCVQTDRYTLDTHMYVKCSCSHMTSFAVLMDISDQEYVPAEPIAVEIVTYIGLVISMGCLVACFFLLFCLKRVQCNTNSIHINLIFVIFITLLSFILGINKTEDQFKCRLVAIALHYFFMTGFSWLFVDVLHMYRMLTEIRNIDVGSMKFYYLIAYVIPGIVVSLAVGLNTEGYGNKNFCWLMMSDKFIWSFAGPISVSVIINIFVLVLAMKASCMEKIGVSDTAPLRIGLFANIIILLIWGITWVSGLLSVNYNYQVLHVIFSLLCLALGVFIFIMYIIVNSKVRHELKKLWYRLRGQKLDLDDNIGGTRSSLYSRSALAYRNDSCDGGLARINVGISTTSTTSRSTSKSSGGLYKGEDYLRSTSTSTSGNMPPVKYPRTDGLPPPYGYDPENPDDPDSMQIHPKRENNDSDSDSEMSERVSLDLASSHSSDEEDDIDVQMDWESQIPKNKKIEEAKEQMRKKKEEFLQQQQQQQQQQPSPMAPSSQHQYHNPFDQHIYAGPPSPKYSPKPLHAPGHWPGDPQLSGYTGSDSEYRTSDHPTLSSTQPDVTLQTPEYKGREFKIATPRRTNSIMNESMSSSGNSHTPMGSPQVVRAPQEAPRSPVQKYNSPLHSPRDLSPTDLSPRDRMKVKVLTHRGSVSSDSECSHETCV
ncbi:cadherin EGF LAG seven-pass G-type receptor 2-like isoform X2 [Ruditapes philippinarum]|uniref:cadherin EGF LAG seven-pass G-type receptor 2-like isoform X2 n=1 Tax=Ruditapes philippinarum TaxID=129788 RepID=UPI00295B260C|nr:cadherin EGF LAG seven-pass G-type receptor 2-like isoform X2 [Ruditapes philippinarum]